MDARLHDDRDAFLAHAGPLYRRDPVLHTIELTALGAGIPAQSLMVTVHDGHTAVGAALQTPPYPLLVTGLAGAATECAAELLAETHPDLHGIRGVRDVATRFAAAWQSATGRVGHVDLAERLYRLGTLAPPAGVRGACRLGTGDDHALLVDWVEGFFVETFNEPRDDAAGARFLARAADVGDRFVLWTLGDEPVSMAMLRAPASGVSRIGPVYTPTAARGQGFGSAVTAAAARLAHRSGTGEVVLFADSANPVSNGIYRRIGFEAVTDCVRIDFAGA
ncbi:GNAT family N-acetyltransferase [Mycolicibacterium psychrotolerans]|uniref:N-acetyltransferase n=1 Tax=Mycolicibacterium psychrotolerans TaxID=216929 RepID=A0A7I7M4M3_9MYCO|nr:GNAT family N-acetyltransferase [Mycolicibacterium psychrotolerans]BBX67138.1 N-acetyltransferase [Mycolicibacterium psychrotolerans]